MLQAILSFLSGIITKIMGDVINDALSKPGETTRVEVSEPDSESPTDRLPPVSNYDGLYFLHRGDKEGKQDSNDEPGADS